MNKLPQLPGIKAVFTDLDNTLWIPQAKTVPKSNEVTLRALKTRGIPVIPVTGRTLNAVRRAIHRNGLEELNLYPGVYCDGAIVYNHEQKIVYSNFLSQGVVYKVRELMSRSKRDGMLGYFCHNAFKTTDLKRAIELYAYPPQRRERFHIQDSSHDLRKISAQKRRSLEDLSAESTRSSEGNNSSPEVTRTPRTPWDDNIEELPARLENEKIVYFYIDGTEHEAIAEDVRGVIGNEGLDYCKQNPKYTVIRNVNCDKYAAVRYLMLLYGWKDDECLVVGDGDNDVCMLRRFVNTLVMKDGYEKALEVAKIRTQISAPSGGWGHAISQILQLDD